MSKHNVLFYGDKVKFDNLKGFFTNRDFCLHHVRELSLIESQIIDKNPKLVIITILKGCRLNDIPAQVLEKQRHMAYYFLIAYLDENTEYMKELILKSGFDDVLLDPISEESISYLQKLISTPRREIRAILVQGWAVENHETKFFFAKSKDLSRSGMLFESKKDLSVGQEIKISFVMPIIKENITIVGKVVRMIPPGQIGELTKYGISFVDIPKFSQKVLDKFFIEEQMDEGKSNRDSMS